MKDDGKFKEYFRLSREQFSNIADLIQEELTLQPSNLWKIYENSFSFTSVSQCSLVQMHGEITLTTAPELVGQMRPAHNAGVVRHSVSRKTFPFVSMETSARCNTHCSAHYKTHLGKRSFRRGFLANLIYLVVFQFF